MVIERSKVMKENRFERIARHTDQSKERARLRTHLRGLSENLKHSI